MHDSFHEQGVEGPAHRSPDSQGIASGVQVQDELSVQHHHHHTQESQEGAENLLLAEPFALVEDGQQQGGKEGTGAQQNGHIGSRAVHQCHVLREEIEGASQDTQGKGGELIGKVSAKEAFIGHEPGEHISQ